MIAMTSCTLLRQILRAVLRDESRHVAFGGLYVAEALASMHPDEREAIADFTFEVVQMLRVTRHEHANAEPGFLQMLHNVGIDYADYLRGLSELQQSGVTVELPSQLVHPFKHLTMPALVRVGAVTERARERYAAAGIPVWTDRAMLERMEQAD
jgi:ribonucleotide reductase beta subunit family protein with ferritin-like domain